MFNLKYFITLLCFIIFCIPNVSQADVIGINYRLIIKKNDQFRNFTLCHKTKGCKRIGCQEWYHIDDLTAHQKKLKREILIGIATVSSVFGIPVYKFTSFFAELLSGGLKLSIISSKPIITLPSKLVGISGAAIVTIAALDSLASKFQAMNDKILNDIDYPMKDIDVPYTARNLEKALEDI